VQLPCALQLCDQMNAVVAFTLQLVIPSLLSLLKVMCTARNPGRQVVSTGSYRIATLHEKLVALTHFGYLNFIHFSTSLHHFISTISLAKHSLIIFANVLGNLITAWNVKQAVGLPFIYIHWVVWLNLVTSVSYLFCIITTAKMVFRICIRNSFDDGRRPATMKAGWVGRSRATF